LRISSTILRIAKGAFVQECAGLGRLGAARVTDQERDAQIFLELANLHAEGGLRDVQLLGRAGHVARPYDADEVAEMAKVHAPCRSNDWQAREP
jgi:hypothetical protein